MKEFRRPEIVKTRNLRIPNEYTLALDGDLREYAFNEERAPLNKGIWRTEVFKVSPEIPLDLEIGTGVGVYFRHLCQVNANRCLVGLELKYKPLVQTIRGMLRTGSTNGRVCRSHAFNLDLIFDEGEVDSILMHFPDPWTSPRKPKNRMINPRMLEIFQKIQRPGSHFELKTDSLEYFQWAKGIFQQSPYLCEFESLNWRGEELSQPQPLTQFERIFVTQGLPIYYGLWRRP